MVRVHTTMVNQNMSEVKERSSHADKEKCSREREREKVENNM